MQVIKLNVMKEFLNTIVDPNQFENLINVSSHPELLGYYEQLLEADYNIHDPIGRKMIKVLCSWNKLLKYKSLNYAIELRFRFIDTIKDIYELRNNPTVPFTMRYQIKTIFPQFMKALGIQ